MPHMFQWPLRGSVLPRLGAPGSSVAWVVKIEVVPAP
jgi:hypothetical protein